MNMTTTSFTNTMTKPQTIAGAIYLPVHIFVVPIALAVLSVILPGVFDVMTSYLVYYGIGFVFCLTVMFSFLRKAFDIMLDNKGRVVITIISSYFVYWLLSYLVTAILVAIVGEESLNNPNNAAIAETANMAGTGAMVGIAVFLAPIVEELLFRGALFGAIRTKSRIWAYVVSMALFAVYHVWQYALLDFSWMLLLYAVQYIPAGYAMARCYERTGSIWAPIFLHMINNAVAMLLL